MGIVVIHFSLILMTSLIHVTLCDMDPELESLSLLQVVFRHGDRAPVMTYPSDPNINFSWPDGAGQLTQKGRIGSYHLGQRLRARYNKFLGPFNLSSVYVRSTDMDRTLISAECVLAGLYPPTDKQHLTPHLPWQPIPVHTVPLREDWLSPDAECPKAKEVQDRGIYTPAAVKIHEEIGPLYAELKEKTGRDIPNLRTVIGVYDVLECQASYGLQLPNWTDTVYPQPLRSLAAHGLATFYAEDITTRLRAGPLLKTLMANWKEGLSSNFSRKLFLYSTHDKMIVSTLIALKVFDPIPPPFSSALLFELHHHREIGYTVKILYWNDSYREPFVIKLPECNASCPLDKFIDITSVLLPIDWEKECLLDTSLEPIFSTFSVKDVAVISLAILVCILIAIEVHHHMRRRKGFKKVSTDDMINIKEKDMCPI